MKKIIVFLSLFCFFIFNTDANAYQITADVKTKRIPQGTKLELEMANPLTSVGASVGDMFTAYLTRDVRTQTTMILPRGTIVRGNISNVVNSARPQKAGVLYLNFDHIVAPNGSQIPISAGLYPDFELNDKGGISGGGNLAKKLRQNVSKSGAIIKKSTKWGIDSGEELFKGGKFLVTPFSAAGGTVAAGGYLVGVSIADLFKKGNEVNIEKNKVFNILLLEPLDVPVSE